MKRTILISYLGVVIVAVPVGAFISRARRATQPADETHFALTERGPMLVAVSARGNIEPQARANLAFE